MSRSKDLRNQEDMFINIYDVMSLFVFEKKHKYTETLLRIMKNTQNIDEHVKEIRQHLTKEFGISPNFLSTLSNLQLIFIYRFIDSMFNVEDLKKFQKFCEYNERNLIAENDLTQYKSFDQVMKATDIADMIVQEKEMEKQIKILFKNDEWILLRPLTFESSKKYGSNTKWCTTFNDSSYFTKYSSNGVLIYAINKKNGYKVASYYSLDGINPEFSFWNSTDVRIDSTETELPFELLKVIQTENRSNKTNAQLFDKKPEEKGGLLSKFSSTTNRIASAFIRENDESNMVEDETGPEIDFESTLNELREAELRPLDQSDINEYLTYGNYSTERTDESNVTERTEFIQRILNRR